MSARSALILLLGIAGIAVIALGFRPVHDADRDHPSVASDEEAIGSGGSPERNTMESARSAKSRLRPTAPSLTHQETIELLKETIIDRFAIEDESVGDCVAAINRALRKAGIPDGQLRVEIDARDEKTLSQLYVKEFKARDLPLSDLLKYLCGNSKLRYKVEAGVVKFVDATARLDLNEDSPSLQETDAAGKDADPFSE